MDASIPDPPPPPLPPPPASSSSSSLPRLPPSSPDLGAPASSNSRFDSPASNALPFGYMSMNPAQAGAAAHGGGGDSPMTDAHGDYPTNHESFNAPGSNGQAHAHHEDDLASSSSGQSAADTVMDDAPILGLPTALPTIDFSQIASPSSNNSHLQAAIPFEQTALAATAQHAHQDKLPWISIHEDLSSAGQDELARIRSKGEVSALDHSHWQAKTFRDLNDPELTPLASGTIKFDINGFNGTRDNPNTSLVMHSDPVKIGNLLWRLRVYPKGNGHSYVSAYLVCETLDPKSSKLSVDDELPASLLDTPLLLLDESTLDKPNEFPVQMTLIMYNPQEPRVHSFKSVTHRFSSESPDRGFLRFGPAPWTELGLRTTDSRVAMLRGDKLSFICHLQIHKDPTGFLFDGPNEDNDDTSKSFARTGLWPIQSVSDRRGYAPNLTAAVIALALLPQVRDILYMAENLDSAGKPLASALLGFLCDIRRPLSMLEDCPKSTHKVSVEQIAMGLNWFGDAEGLKGCGAISCRLSDKKLSYPLVRPWHPHGRALQDFDPFQVMEFLVAKLASELEDGEDASKELQKLFGGGGFRAKMQPGSTNIRKGLATYFASQDMSAGYPQLLQIELPRQVFDEQSREWKKNRDRIVVPETLRLTSDGGSWYSLFGLIVHRGNCHSREYSTIVRPDGGKWFEFLDAHRYADERVPHVTCLTKKQALLENEADVLVAIYMRNDVAFKTMFSSAPAFQGYPEDGFDVPSRFLVPYEARHASNAGAPMEEPSPHSSDSEDDDEATPPPPPSQAAPTTAAPTECACSEPSPSLLQEPAMSEKIMEVDYFGSGYYRGTMHKGYRHGHGSRIYPDGNTYEGQFERDLRHGKGKQTFKNGDEYVGEWKNDLMEGQGEYWTLLSGAKYSGGFMKGKRYGKFTVTGNEAEALQQCLICLDEERNAVLYPCGHHCACVGCGRKLERCPYCSRSVSDVIRLYTV